jgi:hypothetical protein
VSAKTFVMPGLAAFAIKLRRPGTEGPAKPWRRRDPGIHHLRNKLFEERWITGSSPVMTISKSLGSFWVRGDDTERLYPGVNSPVTSFVYTLQP